MHYLKNNISNSVITKVAQDMKNFYSIAIVFTRIVFVQAFSIVYQ